MKSIIDKIKKFPHLEKIILIFILLIAAYLRLWDIDGYMTFLGDEGRDVLVVKRMIVDHKFTLLGPTASVGGFFLGPIYYYFMLPFLWAFRLNPVGPAVMVALFGVATVYLVYRAGKDFFNQEIGFLSAFLYTLSPLVITYSHSSWNPNLVPFFSLLYIWSLFKLQNTNRPLWCFVAGLSLGIGFQLHYLFTFLAPIGFIFLIIYKRHLADFKYWLVKFAGILTGWSPFLIFEIRHHFPNTISLYNFIFYGKETGFVPIKIQERLWDIVFRLFGRLVFSFPQPNRFQLYPQNHLHFWYLAVVISLFSSLFILLIQTIQKRKSSHFLLLLWFVFGTVLFLFYNRSVYDYYLGVMFPLPFFLIANLFFVLQKKVFLKPFALIFIFVLIILNWSERPIKYPANHQLKQAETVASLVFDHAQGKPMNFALITNQNSDHTYRYFLEIWGNKPIAIENFENDPQRKTVTDQLLVVCEVDNCQPLGSPLWEIAGFGQAEIVGEWMGPVGIKVIKLKHYQAL